MNGASGKRAEKSVSSTYRKGTPGFSTRPGHCGIRFRGPEKKKACCIRHDHGPVLSGEIAMDNPEDNFCNTGDVDPACGNGDLQAIPDLNIRDGLWGL